MLATVMVCPAVTPAPDNVRLPAPGMVVSFTAVSALAMASCSRVRLFARIRDGPLAASTLLDTPPLTPHDFAATQQRTHRVAWAASCEPTAKPRAAGPRRGAD